MCVIEEWMEYMSGIVREYLDGSLVSAVYLSGPV